MGTITEMPEMVFNADTTKAAAAATGADEMESSANNTLTFCFLALCMLIPELAERVLPTGRLSDLVYLHSVCSVAVGFNQALIYYDHYPIKEPASFAQSVDLWNNFQKGMEDAFWPFVACLVLLTICVCCESDMRKRVHGVFAIANNCTSRILFSLLIYGNFHYGFILPLVLLYYIAFKLKANRDREAEGRTLSNGAPQHRGEPQQ